MLRRANLNKETLMQATEVILCWTPNTDRVVLVPWPDTSRHSDGFECTALACDADMHSLNFEERGKRVYVQAWHLVAFDGVPVLAVHQALLPLDEYRDGLAEDSPGM